MKTRPQSETRRLRIAAVDGDEIFLDALDLYCGREGWRLLRLGAAGLEPQRLLAARPNVLIVDPSHSGRPGLARLEPVCRQIPDLPTIVCTGRSSVAERVTALRLGVDDWLTKPCHPEELLARAESVSRLGRLPTRFPEEPVCHGEIELCPAEGRIRSGPRHLDLTARECDILAVFAAAPGIVLERETIYRRAWGYSMAWGDRSIDVFVQKLRRKLERISPAWEYIHTHHRLGYRFEPEPVAADPDPATPSPGRPLSSASRSALVR